HHLEGVAMPSYKSFFPKKFAQASDFETPQIVTIARTGFENLGDGEKLVIYFEQSGIKPVVLSAKVNGRMIEQITGTEDYARWPGAKLELYQSTTEFHGELKPCIRI